MPDTLLLQLAVPAVIGGVFFLRRLSHRFERLERWKKSARALCRDDTMKTSLIRRQLTARSGANELRITGSRKRSKEVVVEVQGAEGLSVLEIRHQPFKPRRSSGNDIEIGDESFDAQFLIGGPVLEVGARLDEMMRRRLLGAISGCSALEIGGGRLRAEVPDEELRRILPILLDIARRLDEHVPVERRIAENTHRDSFPGVRIFNLQLLARERPGDPDVVEMLREACKDESPAVRLRAAIELGDRGRGVLLKLAQKSVHDESAAQAVTHLGGTLPFETLREILARAMESFSKKTSLPRTARACVEELARRGPAAAGVLSQVLEESKGELAAAAARALGTIGEPSAEPALIRALQSKEDAVWLAAATALGRVGTAAAVPPLQEAADNSRLDRSLRRTARQEITEIQSRLVGAAPGQLSLAGAEGEAGRLSLAAADAGQLSLAADTAGELAVLPHGVEEEGSSPDGSSQRVRPTGSRAHL